MARVEWVTHAMSAEISGEVPIKDGHTPIAVWAMKPRTRAAKSTGGPGHTNILRYSTIVKLKDNKVTRNAHFRDLGPAKGINAVCDPMISERIGALQLAHVEVIDCQFFDRQSFVSRHGVAPNAPSRNA